MARQMEETCDLDPGALKAWEGPPIIKERQLEELMVKPMKRGAVVSSLMQKCTGMLFSITGGMAKGFT